MTQSTQRDYGSLTRDQLEMRLSAAEDVVVLWSWSASLDSTRNKAAYMRWRDWLTAGGSSEAKDNPHLTDASIAEMAAARDEMRAQTLARLSAVVTTDDAEVNQ